MIDPVADELVYLLLVPDATKIFRMQGELSSESLKGVIYYFEWNGNGGDFMLRILEYCFPPEKYPNVRMMFMKWE